MKTILTSSAAEAAAVIRDGGLVAFPTETVYGLGADVFNESAIARIFEAKGRPADNPLIAHIGEVGQVELLASEINAQAKRFIDAFFPSPLTIVLPKRSEVPLIATANLQTIGVRMPDHSLALEFLKECGTPVAAPSANISGRPSPTTWQAVLEDLDGRIDCILKGEATDVGLESTVVDCTSSVPLILRKGAITLEQLRRVVPETRFYEITATDEIRSPGLKHRHYSPDARVVLLNSGEIPDAARFPFEDCAYVGTSPPAVEFKLSNVCESVEEYAHEVFAFFRECDRSGVKTIFCEKVSDDGLGAALMDRLRRAAAG
jgi:L-threonylcarbamoyladenylate synthase